MADYRSEYATYPTTQLQPPEIPLVTPTHPASSSSSFTASLLPASSSSSAVYPLPADLSSSSLSTSTDGYDATSPSDSYQQFPSPAGDDEAQAAAIATWTQRVKICFAAHMITAIALIASTYRLSTVAGCVILLLFYIFAHFRKVRRKNFVWMFLLVVALNLVRDGVILFFEFQTGWAKEWWDYMLLCMLCVDALVVTPCTCYACFYLHRSTAVSNVSV